MKNNFYYTDSLESVKETTEVLHHTLRTTDTKDLVQNIQLFPSLCDLVKSTISQNISDFIQIVIWAQTRLVL